MIMVTFEIALAASETLNNQVESARAKLNEVVGDKKHANGLVFSEVKQSDEFKVAKAEFDAAFQTSRNFNGSFVRKFKKELRQHRKEQRGW